MDNVGCHKMDVLKEIFAEACVDVGFLPPNMTQFLQVLDLVVNGPLKAHIRRLLVKQVPSSLLFLAQKSARRQNSWFF